MNKMEFIAELNSRLSKLPYGEVTNAIAYYEEYFDEAGEEKEQKVIEELESPANVASQIIANFAIKDIENSENSAKKGLSVIWMVILAILASPIALPLALTVVILVLALVIAIFALVFSIGIIGIAFISVGVIYIILSIFLLFQHFATGIFFIGMALVLTGAGITFCKATIFMAKKSFGWLANKISQFLLRRSEV